VWQSLSLLSPPSSSTDITSRFRSLMCVAWWSLQSLDALSNTLQRVAPATSTGSAWLVTFAHLFQFFDLQRRCHAKTTSIRRRCRRRIIHAYCIVIVADEYRVLSTLPNLRHKRLSSGAEPITPAITFRTATVSHSRHNKTRKPCCREETAQCRSCSLRFKIRRQHSLQVQE